MKYNGKFIVRITRNKEEETEEEIIAVKLDNYK